MAKPNILSIAPFDASVGTVINFTFTGSQVYGHQIEIIDNASGTVVYAGSEETMRLSHTVPATSGLVNGVYYACRIRVHDISGVYDSWSDYVAFYCFANPVFRFSNLNAGQLITSSEFEAHLFYSQDQGESINSYVFELYGSNMDLLSRSQTMYAGEAMEYTLRMLESSRSYYLRAVGVTVNNIQLDTGYISFSVAYTTPSMWNYVDLFNNEHDGNIRVSCNVRVVDGIAEDGDVVYIDNKMADLTSGNRVTFSGGYLISNDFNVQIIGKNFSSGEYIFTMNNGQYSVNVKYIEGIFDSFPGECAYFTLTVDTGIVSYQIMSNLFNRPGDSMMTLEIKHIGYLYSLNCIVAEV